MSFPVDIISLAKQKDNDTSRKSTNNSSGNTRKAEKPIKRDTTIKKKGLKTTQCTQLIL